MALLSAAMIISHKDTISRISNITHNTIDITDCVYVEGITDNKFKISKGDLLIAMSGATTGKMGVYCLMK